MNEEFPPLGGSRQTSQTRTNRRPIITSRLNAEAAEFVPSSVEAATTTGIRQDTQFNAMFPALGATVTTTSPRLTPAPPPPPGFVQRQRLMSMTERFGWINSETVRTILQHTGYSMQAAENYLNAHFPAPAGWHERKAAAAAVAAARRTPTSTPRSPGKTKEVGHWVDTGKSVAVLYSELREQAGELARARNACFDRAKKAKLSGSAAEAARLATQGHELNQKMFAKHDEAADAIFEHRNTREQRNRGIIDLHGLHVSEALDRLPYAIESNPRSKVRVLTGSGHHTLGTGKARLRPAVEKWLSDNGYKYEEVQDKNSHIGAFVVLKKSD